LGSVGVISNGKPRGGGIEKDRKGQFEEGRKLTKG